MNLVFTGPARMCPACWSILLHVALGSFTLAAPAFADSPATLIDKHAQWRYFAAADAPPKDWFRPRFDDSEWPVGNAGFGYGDSDDRTVLAMKGKIRSLYLRREFDVRDVATLSDLFLYLNFDDGFIAYINGTPVASSHASRDQQGRLRVSLHEGGRYEEFRLSKFKKLLKRGTNLIAIEGHNASLKSSDFSLDPFLSTKSLVPKLGPNELRADLDRFLERALEDASYLKRRDFDLVSAVKKLEQRIDQEMQASEFLAELHKVVMQLGDCHANVQSNDWPKRGLRLPFRPADTQFGLAALSINGATPVARKTPYLVSIDGVSLDDWIKAAARYVAAGSPQFVRRRALSWMLDAEQIRRELSLRESDLVELGMRSADGKSTATVRLRLTRQAVSPAKVSLGKNRRIGDFGYLRIPAMDERLVDSIVRAMQSYRDTAGLVIDVRDNGGGVHGILMAMYGFFVPDGAAPRVTNVAAFRKNDRYDFDHIRYRPTYRADWEGWQEDERQAISRVAKRFQPGWNLARGDFSAWHYMILSRQRNDRSMTRRRDIDYYHYDRPVVVLCNAASFSATDGFLNALGSLPNITLMGEPSGGGSGARRGFTLPNTRARISLSSMASFMADGRAFDGNGIEVDVLVRPKLADFTSDADSVLDNAVDFLKTQTQP